MTHSAPDTQRTDAVPLAVNVSPEVAAILRRLLEKKDLTVTEGVRHMVKIWEFLEDEIAAGNQIATVAPNGDVHPIKLA